MYCPAGPENFKWHPEPQIEQVQLSGQGFLIPIIMLTGRGAGQEEEAKAHGPFHCDGDNHENDVGDDRRVADRSSRTFGPELAYDVMFHLLVDA